MVDIQDKVVIVTGSASGIGKSIAEAFAKQKCKLALLDIDDENGIKTAEELKAYSETEYFHCDVSSVDSIKKVFDSIIERFGYVDVLVNNAGMPVRDYIEDIDETKWNAFIAVNMKAVFFLSQIVAEHIKNRETGYGRIINMSSVRSKAIDDYHAGYIITKAAVNAITKCFAVSYGEYGITANAIAPGFVLTPMTEHYYTDPKAAELIKTVSPIRRMVDMTEIADLALYMASKNAGAVNGQIIMVDGGGVSFSGVFQ